MKDFGHIDATAVGRTVRPPLRQDSPEGAARPHSTFDRRESTVTRQPAECRLRITSGALALAFRATLDQARNFTAALAKWSPALQVTIDSDISAVLPSLPYSRLWD
ncbi:hypothetical protein [Nocardia sp. NPDC051463]|uniref:hypothetical protein n=1 Tax=Nocardia sp. NPDC051463 TaxID=3154845 RepID=UPI003428CD27